MKKTVVCMLIAAMTMGSMVTPVFADGEGDATHIYVLTAPEDHGWTGSVATFAKEKIEEVNDAGTYSAELITTQKPISGISLINTFETELSITAGGL